MSDKFFVGQSLTASENNGRYKPVSRVTLLLDDNNEITEGDDTGYEIVASCPHATQDMANAILAKTKGYTYQAYSASDSTIDPAFELGDGVTADGIYGMIGAVSDDGSGFPSLSAPGESEQEGDYPTVGPLTQQINRKIKSVRSEITKTAEEIRLYVTNEIDGVESEITQTATEIKSYVNDEISGVNSTISQTADSLTAKISSVDGRVTSISADLNGIEARVQGVEGDYSSLSIQLGSISSTVSDIEGNVSTVEQTVNGLRITTNGLSSDISGISSDIDGLSTGETLVSAGCIRTGKIKAARIDTTDLVAEQIGSGYVGLVSSSGSTVGNIRIASSSSAMSGQGVQINAPAVGIVATSGDVFLTSRGEATYIHVGTDSVVCKGGFNPTGVGAWNLGSSSNKWANVYAVNGVIQTSDRTQKTNISYDLSRYEPFFDALKPGSYIMENGGVRTHLGLVSQDIEEILTAAGLTDLDFAGFIRSPKPDGSGYDYALRYAEFIPLLIWQVQKLKARVAILEAS